MANSRGKELAKNTGIIALGTFLPKLAAFVTLPILTGLLTKEEYGTYDLVTVMVSLLLPALTLQIKAAAFRFLIDARDNPSKQKAIVTTIMVVTIPVSLVALAIMFVVLARVVTAAISFLVCAYYFADIFSNTFRQIARGMGRNLDYSISAVLSAAGKMVFAAILVWGMQWGLLGAVIALGASSSVSALYLVCRLNILSLVSSDAFDKKLLKDLVAYSWPLVPNEISLWAIQMGQRVIITAVLGLSANAVFSVATKIPQIVSLAQSAFTLAWQENASIAQKDEDAALYYSQMFKTMFGLQAGFMGIVVAATPLLFPLLVNGDYDESYRHIPILCLSIFFSSMSTFLGGIYVAHMASKSVGLTTTVAAAVSIALCALLIKPLGVYAASLSMLVSYTVLLAFRMFDVRKLIALQYYPSYMAVTCAVMIIECLLCYQQSVYCNVANGVIALVAFAVLNKSFLMTVKTIIGSHMARVTKKRR